MGDFSLLGSAQISETAGRVTASTNGTTVTSSATTETKGSWTELVASTTRNCSGLMIHVHESVAGSSETYAGFFLVDIGVGGAGSEVAIALDLPLHGSTASTTIAQVTGTIYLPLAIPAGTRISARCQSPTDGGTGNSLKLSLTLFHGDWAQSTPGGRTESSCTGGSDSLGTPISPNSSAHTKGSYVTVVTSTSKPWAGFHLFAYNKDNSSSCRVFIDLAVGGAGSEQVLLADVPFYMEQDGTGYNIVSHPPSIFFPLAIPSGSTIRCRCAVSISSGNWISVSVVGIIP